MHALPTPTPASITPKPSQIAHLEPIQARYAEVMRDEGALDAILAQVGRWRSWQEQARALHARDCRHRQRPACSPNQAPSQPLTPPLPASLGRAGRGRRQRAGHRHAGQRTQGHGFQRAAAAVATTGHARLQGLNGPWAALPCSTCC